MLSPVLPSPALMYWGIALAWAGVLAAGAAWLGWRYVQWREDQRSEQFGYVRQSGRGLIAGAAMAGAVLALLPGDWGLSYWLGLAFLMPSWVSLFLCLWYLKRLLWVPRVPKAAHAKMKPPVVRTVPPTPLSEGFTVAAVVAAVLGWWALLDTVLAFPVSLYHLGFGPWMPVALLLLIGLPWLVHPLPAGHPLPWLVAGALLLFAVLRLPTGNAMDAVLDPWLWVVAQAYLVRRFMQNRRMQKQLHALQKKKLSTQVPRGLQPQKPIRSQTGTP